MKYLITDLYSLLGKSIRDELISRGEDNIFPYSFNITNKEEVLKVIKSFKPDVIIHNYSLDDVDLCEKDNDLCNLINVSGTNNIVEGAILNKSKLIYISSNYVFDGNNNDLFNEDSISNPINNFGMSIRNAENIVSKYNNSFIVRTSNVFGHGDCFVNDIIDKGYKNESIDVVGDQFGSLTYAPDLAFCICDLALTDNYGIYNITNNGYACFCEFARWILYYTNIKCDVNPITLSQYKELNKKFIAERPKKSVLDNNKFKNTLLVELPTWYDALYRYTNNLNKGKVLIKKSN